MSGKVPRRDDRHDGVGRVGPAELDAGHLGAARLRRLQKLGRLPAPALRGADDDIDLGIGERPPSGVDGQGLGDVAARLDELVLPSLESRDPQIEVGGPDRLVRPDVGGLALDVLAVRRAR